MRWKIFIVFSIVCTTTEGQLIVNRDSLSPIHILSVNPRIYQNQTGDSIWIYSGICKTLKTTILTGDAASQLIPKVLPGLRKLILSGNGDISYQRFQRKSASDNLFLINSTSDIAALRLSLIYKESYPVSLYFKYSQSRPFQLDNQYEFNISFDEKNYKEMIRDRIAGMLKVKFLQKQAFIQNNYEKVFRQFQEQKEFLESPAYMQRTVENRFLNPARDRLSVATMSEPFNARNLQDTVTGRLSFIRGFQNAAFNPALQDSGLPSIPNIQGQIKDSIEHRIEDARNGLHIPLLRRKDSLETLMKKYEDSIAQYKRKFSEEVDSLNKEIAELRTNTDLEKFKNKRGLKDSIAKGPWTDILMKASFRFGKFILNNSELTVNNIFLHGISLKYGDEKFIQLSAGYYDFAFLGMFNLRRDTGRATKQSVVSLRVGKTDGRNLQAINIYTGRKHKPGSVNNQLYTIAGVSLERRIFINRNVDIDLELAKSTTRFNSFANKENSTLKDLFGSLNGKAIGGNVSARVFLPATQTDAEFNYKYFGQQFESFNASQYFNPQSNLGIRINQPFFKKKLNLSSGIRYTDFKSYGISSNLKSKTFFASLNATLRVKKLPIVSVGYYPGSQLYWMEGSRLYEYFYYILNTTATHYFVAGKLPMQGVFTYNKFVNQYKDSLVNSAQSCHNIFWTTWAGKFSYQLNYSRQTTELMKLSTLEAGINYGGNKIKIGGALKWNITGQANRMGYSSSLGALLGKIGTVSIIYDRSFLPERTGFIVPVTTGQIQIIKPIKFRIWQKG